MDFDNDLWRWEKHRGGWIVLAFSSFSPTEVTDQKQIEFNFWSVNQNLNAADKNREREKKDTKQLYKFLPQTGSSPVPFTTAHFYKEGSLKM